MGSCAMIILNDGTEHEFYQPFIPNIESIAFALSNINRFTGHVGQYSVAQHCVMIAEALPEPYKLAGLLHDAPEAYIGDVSAPLKRLLPEYKKLEKFYHQVIDSYFNVQTEHPLVKEYDVRMLISEAEFFNLPTDKFPNAESLYTTIGRVWPAEYARHRFLSLFEDLTFERIENLAWVQNGNISQSDTTETLVNRLGHKEHHHRVNELMNKFGFDEQMAMKVIEYIDNNQYKSA